ncbi:P-loop containing nucleoside triphosphate hydrolase protein [Coemansia spiralis]|nr:P-loop containing nucleoside triphosphate hydrolase protein [Coemansia spiralis]
MTTSYAQHKRSALKHALNPPADPPSWHGYVLAVSMFSMLLLYTWSFQWYFFEIGKATIITRTALVSAIYRKSLVLSLQARARLTMGQLTNLLSSDISQIERGITNMIFCVTIPIQALASVAVLVYMIGPVSISGWALVVALVPLQMWASRYLTVLRAQAVKYADKRIGATREALQGIKVVKLFVWENSVLDTIQRARAKELSLIARLNLVRYSLIAFALHSPVFASIITFAIFVITGGKLKNGPVFAVIGIFNSMALPLSWLPGALAETRNSTVPLKRITEMLMEEELSPKLLLQPNLTAAICITNGCFATLDTSKPHQQTNKTRHIDKTLQAYKFPRSSNSPETSNIDANLVCLNAGNVEISRGTLVAVVGAVGSGKSLFISALAGEIKPISGTVALGGSMSYAPQVPWVMNSSIRENITFGLPFDKEKYINTIEACSLDADFEGMPDGDLTEVGERGVTLSGGQKQRLSIARAAYAESDIVLLDDCLSAVDVKVSREIFRHCIKGLLAGKTRILVTNNLDLLPMVDFILTISEGRIVEQGPFSELLAINGTTAAIISVEYSLNTEKHAAQPYLTDLSKRLKRPAPSSGQLMSQEERTTGQIALSTYITYIKAGGGYALFFGIILCLAITQGCRVGSDFWMRLWIKNRNDKSSTQMYIGMYALLAGLQLVWFMLFAMLLVFSTYMSSKKLHNQAIRHVLRSPMRFFDTTPLGRLLNRFTRDIDSLDLALCEFFRQFYQNISRSLASFVSISILVPIFIAPLAPLFVASWILIYVYMCMSVEIQRLAAIARSPLYAHYNQTLQGLATIRAFNAQSRYIALAEKALDDANRPQWYATVAQNWVWLRVDFISHLLSLVVCVVIVAQPTKWDAAAVGLLLVQATQMGVYVTYAGRGWTELQNNMNSVERIDYYATSLEQEAEGQKPNSVAMPDTGALSTMRHASGLWPERGTVIIRDLTMHYRKGLPPALRGINMEMYDGDRIAIVGRSGAGKSSIISALFRLTEPSDGRIFIDGVDTQTLSLEKLRRSIGILPQDPVLFNGSLRDNLDPNHEFSDSEIWNVVDRMCLHDHVALHPERLDMPVGEEGGAFSVGQRQLLCLARTLLRKPRILVLDEATANVDYKTDATIQRIILSTRSEMTVISIAHRLQTIINYDKVYVVDSGEIVESGPPLHLLERHLDPQHSDIEENEMRTSSSQKKPSIFHDMIREMGPGAVDRMLAQLQASQDIKEVK